MKFQNAEGYSTQFDDPKRMVWYGICGYWTDNWEKLVILDSRIPCCPFCGAPGFQITAKEWLEGAEKFEIISKENKGYYEWLNENKDKCFRGVGLMKTWMQQKTQSIWED